MSVVRRGAGSLMVLAFFRISPSISRGTAVKPFSRMADSLLEDMMRRVHRDFENIQLKWFEKRDEVVAIRRPAYSCLNGRPL